MGSFKTLCEGTAFDLVHTKSFTVTLRPVKDWTKPAVIKHLVALKYSSLSVEELVRSGAGTPMMAANSLEFIQDVVFNRWENASTDLATGIHNYLDTVGEQTQKSTRMSMRRALFQIVSHSPSEHFKKMVDNTNIWRRSPQLAMLSVIADLASMDSEFWSELVGIELYDEKTGIATLVFDRSIPIADRDAVIAACKNLGAKMAPGALVPMANRFSKKPVTE